MNFVVHGLFLHFIYKKILKCFYSCEFDKYESLLRDVYIHRINNYYEISCRKVLFGGRYFI
jgi:hypothetical protein